MSAEVTERPGVAVVTDLVAVLGLTGLAVVGLGSTFAGWGFWVLTLAAAGLGVLVIILTVRLPVSVALAALPIVAVVLGGPVALRSPGLGAGVPDLKTLADVMQGSVTGWGELLATLPYVDLDGPPAMAPFLLGYAGAGLAFALALRTRSAGLPVLPLLGVLVLVLLLRRPEDGVLDQYPLAFAALAVVWVVLRGLELSADRATAVRGAVQGRAGRAVTAALIVVAALAVAVPLTSGGSSSAGESLRGQLRGPGELSGLDSPLRRFRTFTAPAATGEQNVRDRLLLRVTGAPRGSRVRLLTLDRYDGREWQPGNDTMSGTTQDAFLTMDSEVDNPTRGRAVRVQVSLARAYRSAWVPTVGSLRSLRFLLADADSRRSQLRYDLATSTAVVPVGVGGGDDYEFTAVVPDDRLTRTMRPWPDGGLDVVGASRVDPLLRRVRSSPAPAMRKVFVMARYLREEGRFSDGARLGETQYLAGHDLRRLTTGFLLAGRPVGDDEQYAAAMALVANRLGVPARVVVGAVLPRDGKVRGEDVHAWVELRVADGSWRTLPTRQFMGDRPPRRGMAPAQRPSLPATVTPQEPEVVTAPEVAREREQARQEQEARRSLVLRALPWMVALGLLLVVPLAKRVRRAVRRRRGRPSDRMAAAWTELVDHARDLGIAVRPRVSRPAQARALALAGGGEELPHRADDGVFAPREPAEVDVAAYWDQVLRERRQLGSTQPWRRRLWAPFNPVTLLPRRWRE